MKFVLYLLVFLSYFSSFTAISGEIDRINFSSSQNVLIRKPQLKNSKIEVLQSGKNQNIIAGGTLYQADQSHIFLTEIKNQRINPQFGEKGIKKISFSKKDQIYGLDIDDYGRILIAGFITQKSHKKAFIARFFRNGEIDSSFGKNGIFIFNQKRSSEFHFLRIDSKNRPVVTGYFQKKSKIHGLVMRFTNRGNPDLQFAKNGRFEWIHSKKDRFFGLTLKNDHVITTGSTYVKNQNENCVIVQLNEKGKFKKSFIFDSGPLQDICAGVITHKNQIFVTGFKTISNRNTDIFLGGLDQHNNPLWNQKGFQHFDYYQDIDTAHGISIMKDKIYISGEYHQKRKTRFSPDGFALIRASINEISHQKFKIYSKSSGPYGINGMTVDLDERIWLGGYIKNQFTLAGLGLLE